MSTLRRIVLATDFSEEAMKALSYALRIAEHHQAELHLLHVKVLIEPAMVPPDFTDLDKLEADRDQYVDEQFAKLVLNSSVEVQLAVERANRAAPAIARYAESHDTDLVVVGSHGYTGLQRMVLGSETQNLVRQSKVPVLVVRPDSREPVAGESPFGTLMVPLDLSPASAPLLSFADDLARDYRAELLVTHAADVAVPAYYPLPPRHHQAEAEKALKRFMNDHPTESRTKTEVVIGRAGEAIVQLADSRSVDMIVMSRTGLGALQRFMLGSVTERVLHSAHCPVLVLPATQAK